MSTFYIVIGNFEFPQSFATLAVWMLAGLVHAGQVAERRELPAVQGFG